MPYIGRGISQLQTIDKLDAITPSTSTGAGPYNLTQSSSAFTPISANNLLISINGVVQYGNFTVSGSTVTFTGALSDSDTCNFILHVGEGVVNTPGAGTVTGSSVASSFDISSKTVTLPASVSGLGTGITNAQLAGSIANSKLANSSITINGSAVSLGGSTTIATGIEWQSTIVTGATLSATANYGYWIDTTSNACTVTLPGSASVGDEIWFIDYARNFATNNLIINTNSLNFQGDASTSLAFNTNGTALHIVYSGATKGWIPTEDDRVDNALGYEVEYLIVGGGGGGGHGYTGGYYAGGGGAGGYRNSFANETSGRNSSTESPVTLLKGNQYTVTVGAQGAAGSSNGVGGSNGGDSSISGTGITTITSLGGGYGMGGNETRGSTAGSGGSGGGSADGVPHSTGTGGSGTAGQGFDGGDTSGNNGAGGGGASADGADGNGTPRAGGAGLSSTITGSAVTRATGGNGADSSCDTKTANSGDGGDGSTTNTVTPSAGATGVVILRMLTANYTGTTTGSPTVSTTGSSTILIFTGSGSYTA